MSTVKGMLAGSNGSSYAGHRVVALFEENVTLPRAPDDSFLRQTQTGTETAPDGTFSLELPEQKQIQGAYVGGRLATKRVLSRRCDENVKLSPAATTNVFINEWMASQTRIYLDQ